MNQTQRGDPQQSGALLDPRFLRMLKQLSFRLQGRVRGPRRGERPSRRQGVGGDFVDLRPYTPGDDLRHLDWHLFARLDALLVRLYEEPQEHSLHILLDRSASMGLHRGLFTRQLAAALAFLALVSGDRVALYTLGHKVEASLGPLRGQSAAHKIFDFLSRASFQGTTDLHAALRDFSRVRQQGTLLLLSDFLVPTGRAEAIEAMARTGCRAAALQILSPQERLPPLGDDHTFLDAETGQQLVVHVDKRTRDSYLAALHSLEDEVRQSCHRYGFPFVPLTSDAPLEEVLMGPLRSQGLVGG